MIIERYIRLEIMQKFAAIIALLVLIFISKYYVSYLADAAAGEIASSAVLQLLGLKILSVIPRLLPVALFLAVILAFARFHRDNEMVIVSASGQQQMFFLRTVLRLVLILFIPFTFMVLFSSPWAEEKISLTKDQARKQSDISGLGAGQFKEFSKGDRVVYMQDMSADRRSMEEVFVQIRQNDKLGVMSSDKARFEWHEQYDERYAVFGDGIRYVGKPGELNYQVTNYETYGLLMRPSRVDSVAMKIESMSTLGLLALTTPQQQAELQKRISSLILFLFLPMLAVILSTMSFDDRQYQYILIVVMSYFLYSNLVSLSKTLVAKSRLSPFIGVWWVHIIMIIFLLLLLRMKEIRKWMKGNSEKQQVLSSK